MCFFQGEPAEQVELDDQWKPVYLFLAHPHEARLHHDGCPDCHTHLPDNHRDLHPPVCIFLLQPAPPRLPHWPSRPPCLTHHHPQRELCLLLLPLLSSPHHHTLQPTAAVPAHHPPVSPAVPASSSPPAPPHPPFPCRTRDTVRDGETVCAHDDAGPYHQHKDTPNKTKHVHLHTTFLIMDV